MADQHNDTTDTSRIPKRSWVSLKCAVCGVTVWVSPCRASIRKHCSRKCAGVATGDKVRGKFGADHPGFHTGEHIDKYGYRQILISGDKSVKGNYRYKGEHTLNAEKVLGRHLKEGEVVHHIDCDRLNNKNSNLLVCRKGYHHWLHREMSEQFGLQILRRTA